MSTPKYLGAVVHSPPEPKTILLVPAMVAPRESDPSERWMLQCAPGNWRYQTLEDLLCILRQLSPEEKKRAMAALSGEDVREELGR